MAVFDDESEKVRTKVGETLAICQKMPIFAPSGNDHRPPQS